MKLILFTLTIALACSISAQVDLSKGLVADYNFNGNLDNSAGSHSNGTANGGTLFTTSKSTKDSSSVRFDGINDNISIDFDSFNLNTYTYSLWTKTNSLASNGTCEVIFSLGGSGGDQTIQLCNSVSSSASPFNLNGYYGGGYISGINQSRVVNNVLPDTAKWHHLSLVRFDKGMKFYVNCILVDSIIDNDSPNYGNKTSVTIGSRFGSSNFYHGQVDNLKVYNRVLNLTEIQTLGECLPSSIIDITKNTTFKICLKPNPGSNTVNLSSESDEPIQSIAIYNMLGVLILKQGISNNELSIETKNWNSGTYFFVVRTEDAIITKQYIKY